MTTQETLIQLIDDLKIPAEWQNEVLMACISSYNTGVWDASERAQFEKTKNGHYKIDKQSILKLMIK